MSPIKKYFSIAPRGNVALLPIVSFFVLIFWLITKFESLTEFFVIFVVFWFVADYILITIQVNSQACMDRIISSISRTNNDNYAQILSKFGKIYDCSIPKILRLTRENKERLEDTIKNKKTEDIIIPTFENSVHNY